VTLCGCRYKHICSLSCFPLIYMLHLLFTNFCVPHTKSWRRNWTIPDATALLLKPVGVSRTVRVKLVFNFKIMMMMISITEDFIVRRLHREQVHYNSAVISSNQQTLKAKLNYNIGQCSTWWLPCRIQVAPSVQRRKVWMTPLLECRAVTLPI